MESASVRQWLLLLLAVAFADISVLADPTIVATSAKFVNGTPTPSIVSNTTLTIAPTTGSSNTTVITTNTTVHATTANTSSTVVTSTTKGTSTSSSGSITTASAATASTKAVTKANVSISTDTPSTAAVSRKTSKFDLGSFIGGIILTLGLFVVLYLACRFYNSRRGVRYRTIDEHEAII